MENNYKLDNRLKNILNLPESLLDDEFNIGYDKTQDLWEVIVKYNGSFERIKKELNIKIEILSANYAIIKLKKIDIYKLVEYREIEYIEIPRNLTFVLDKAIPSICIPSLKIEPKNLTGKGTIVAIIDSGINYLHKDFRNKDGSTRILYIWDQTIEGNPPEGFLNGYLYTEEDINKALNNQNPLNIVPHLDEVGHGTAVAGVACGNGASSNGKYMGVANESQIIVVKLGETGQKSFAKNTEIMRAIKFVLDKGIEFNMPVSINLSFGTNDGSHTGKSLFETYIDDMSNIWKTSICVATGNEGSSSHHYENILKTGEEKTIEIITSSDLRNLDIVLFKNFSDIFSIKVIAPNGLETGFLNQTSRNIEFNFGNSSIYIYWGEPVPYTLEQEILFKIFANEEFIENGIWKIVIFGTNIVSGNFNIWLPITEIASKNTKFLSPSSFTTLTIPSTASNVISVGGYNNLINSVADFSGRGFTRNKQIKPDIVAPAVNIRTTSNTGGYDTFSGTSIANPFVTGSCALLMQWGIVEKNDLFLYGERMKAFLRIGAKRKNNISYPNEEWGFGSLCLSETLKYLELYKSPLIQRKDNLEKMNLENNNIINENEDAFYSEKYISILAQYNQETAEIIDKLDYVKKCKVVSGDFVILAVKEDYLERFLQEEISYIFQVPILLGLMDTSSLEASGVLAVQNQPFLNLKGTGVLIGIVDTGINYTIKEFLYEDNTTKIVSIWDQSIKGNPPKNQCFGTEFLREQINEALASENPFDIVPSKDEIGHGTNIASICSARESVEKNFVGVAPDSELVVVKLKQAKNNLKNYFLVPENKIAYDSNDLILGIQYLYEKARELNKPIAICIGLGSNFGSHNGNSILEQYFDDIASKNGVALCVCTGNEGDKEHHSLIKLTEIGVEKSFEVRVGENEEGFILSISTYPMDKIGINVISPTGERTGRIPPRNNYDEDILFPLSNTRIRIQYFSNIYQGTGQLILITLKKPSFGIWKFNVYAENLLIGNVHAWLPISEFISNETYFLNSDPFYTVTIPCTANSVISSGGYNHFNNSFFIESGRGPTKLGSLRPVICAPSSNVSSIGNTGNLEFSTGTSIGTAITTGCSALLLEWGIVRKNKLAMNSVSIAGNLISGAKNLTNETLPNNLWGFGALNILSTFENL